MFGGRSITRVLSAATRRGPYSAAANMVRGIEQPYKWLPRYVFGGGSYPTSVTVRTLSGPRSVRMWSHHDLLTVNEIFFRKDYAVEGSEKVIVDFGSNVGISAVYFLTSCPAARVRLFEPVDFNIARLREQLAGFEDRYQLAEFAVGVEDGMVTFGVEESGRYGGIGKPVGRDITVRCRNASSVLSEILSETGHIDILKIDIEGMEQPVLESLGPEITERIGTIYAETRLGRNPITTHDYRQSGWMATFRRKK